MIKFGPIFKAYFKLFPEVKDTFHVNRLSMLNYKELRAMARNLFSIGKITVNYTHFTAEELRHSIYTALNNA